MRADRLVSLVLLLRQRGRLSATVLAKELEVSTRTVLRDIEALSAAGVPVYAERGRYGGFQLLPTFRTELMGFNRDEALALSAAGSGRGEQLFGLGSALSSAMRKIIDALPEERRASATDAAGRFLIDPATDLLSRRSATEVVPPLVMDEVRRAVISGRRLRLHYAAVGEAPRWRVVDPLGLVTVRGRVYLLATRSDEHRTYRLSRALAAEELAVQARRPSTVDLEALWRERSARFLSGGDHVEASLRVRRHRHEELLDTALAVKAQSPDVDGWLRLDVTFQDSRHAEWAVWQLGADAEALSPPELRRSLYERAAAVMRQHDGWPGERLQLTTADACCKP